MVIDRLSPFVGICRLRFLNIAIVFVEPANVVDLHAMFKRMQVYCTLGEN